MSRRRRDALDHERFPLKRQSTRRNKENRQERPNKMENSEFQGAAPQSNVKLLRAAALDALMAELGSDFTLFVTMLECESMIEERIESIAQRNGFALAA